MFVQKPQERSCRMAQGKKATGRKKAAGSKKVTGKASEITGRKARLSPLGSLDSLNPRANTRETRAAEMAKKTLPNRHLPSLKKPGPKEYRPNQKIGLDSEHTLFFLPGGDEALDRMISQKQATLKNLNQESAAMFQEGSVNLEENSMLNGIEREKVAMERMIQELKQIKSRAFELSPDLVKKIQVFTEEVPDCAADLVKRRNHEIIVSAPGQPNGHVAIGSRVTVSWLDSGEKKTFLVGSFYANGYGAKDEVSYATRLAQAAMGAAKGAVCELEIRNGNAARTREFRVIHIA